MKIKPNSTFITEEFLLQTEVAKELYHNYAAKMPIIDYHNHLSAELIAKNEGFEDITQAWLAEDHYKWRAMRANGVQEKYITGNASSKEKFEKWASTVPYTIKNPLFHWTHLELQRYFGITKILQEDTANEIFEKSSEILKKTTPEQLLLKMNVEVVCTTDDPIDNLEWHQLIAKGDFKVKVLPTFRSDNIIQIEADGFLNYIEDLETVSTISINDLSDLVNVLQNRINYFEANGCKLSDYGLTGPLQFGDFTFEEANYSFKKKFKGGVLNEQEIGKYRSFILHRLAVMYHDKGWTQQYHLGPIRNNNSRLIKQFGADAGCDSIGDYSFVTELSNFFDSLDAEQKLTKTITYNLNPSENEIFATMMGNFNSGDTPGKMQWGSAWWFLDQKEGIEKQIGTLSNMGLLSRFIGMLTDSRSFLSFTRHEYFRRILCNVIGQDVVNGELPNDIVFLGSIVEDICYNNAKSYFKF